MTKHGTIRIPDHEYKERVKRAAAILQRKGLDAMIVNSTESDWRQRPVFFGVLAASALRRGDFRGRRCAFGGA